MIEYSVGHMIIVEHASNSLVLIKNRTNWDMINRNCSHISNKLNAWPKHKIPAAEHHSFEKCVLCDNNDSLMQIKRILYRKSCGRDARWFSRVARI